MKITVFCDTERRAKRYAIALYRYYRKLYKRLRDGREYKPILAIEKNKVFLPVDDKGDLIYLEFLDYLSEYNFDRRVKRIHNPVLIWYDETMTGSKTSISDLATNIAKVYFLHKDQPKIINLNTEENENGKESND